MTYDQAIDFLYTQLPMFQRIGAPAYKPGLDTSIALAAAFGNPQDTYKTIHVGGTNGKGSTAHTLAAILQSSGYRVGLYTSPHLVDFRERIRVDGKMMPREAVTDFVERYRKMDFDGSPSFFELTMVMAFEYFAKAKVDVAVIEVGLGGRLDSTNIIHPCLSVITNISFDHTQFLGDTLPAIASEKAGIIKHGVPVVIGESCGDVRKVFADKASETGTVIRYADDEHPYTEAVSVEEGVLYRSTPYGDITGELSGDCQLKNTATILVAVDELRKTGWNIDDAAVKTGFARVCGMTGLMGRWMKLADTPLTICDTGHNTGGWQYLSRQLDAAPGRKHIVIGFVSDKDVTSILKMLPAGAVYYFTRASIARAMDENLLREKAVASGLNGDAYHSVMDAYRAAKAAASDSDTVFIGGSTFVVADLLASLRARSLKFRGRRGGDF